MVSELREVQLIELEMLKQFHKVCQKLNLEYFSLGGTLLGAVRHNGFIPWDDDIDLGMPRSDYEKFINKAQDYFPENIKLIPNPMNLNILQLVNTDTKIKVGKVTCGVFIDIFPLDGFPDGSFKAFLHDKRILFYRMLCKLSVIDILEDRDRGAIENWIVRLTKVTRLNKILDSEKLLIKLHSIIQNYDYSNSTRVGNVLGRYRLKEVVNKEIFGKGQSLQFENISIKAPSQTDAYLTHIYGDYKKLPPVENQVAHDIKIISLGKDNY